MKPKLLNICAAALILCLASAIYADNSVSQLDGRTDWDSFGQAIWITILITIPSAFIFLGTAAMIIVKKLKSRINKS